jgi:light-regulated signal transduction histidine kinase (bacteriophytochrome)
VKLLEGISLGSRIALLISTTIIIIFFLMESFIVFGFCKPTLLLAQFGWACILLFIPPFCKVVHEFIKNKEKIKNDLSKKNIYLEHAAKIIRHDMHSGINTYSPEVLSSLQRRLDDDQKQKLRAPTTITSDGVKHAQKVYNGVYEFTNLVKDGSSMSKQLYNVKVILNEYLSLTAYKHQVLLDDNLPTELEVNEPLFCTAVDNLIRNGLKYNESPTKWVKIYYEEEGGHKGSFTLQSKIMGEGMTKKN